MVKDSNTGIATIRQRGAESVAEINGEQPRNVGVGAERPEQEQGRAIAGPRELGGDAVGLENQ